MTRRMKHASLAASLLRVRLAMLAAGAPACVVIALWGLGIAGWLWLLLWQAQLAPTPRPAGAPAPQSVSPAPVNDAGRNLILFYDKLGQRRYVEQQVRTVFALAAQKGLALRHGDYRYSYDQSGRFGSYHVLLPVTGSYPAIWDFALRVLGTVPFVALEAVSFRRASIADPAPQAHLRLRFYVKDDAR